MPETSTNQEGGPEQGQEQTEESKEKKLEKGIASLWDNLIAKSPALNTVFEQNGKNMGNLIESFKNGGGNMDEALKAAIKVKEIRDRGIKREQELKNIKKEYSISDKEIESALKIEDADEDKTLRTFVKKKANIFRRAYWKIGDALDISKIKMNRGIRESDLEVEDAKEFQKVENIGKLVKGKVGWMKRLGWAFSRDTELLQAVSSIKSAEEVKRIKEEIDQSIKSLGELLSLSKKVEEHIQTEGGVQPGDGPDNGHEEEKMSDEEMREREREARETLGDELNEEEQRLKNLIGEEVFTQPEEGKKTDKKFNMEDYDKDPNKIFHELADVLGGKEFRKRREQELFMHEFADALNRKERPKKSAEPLKKPEPRKDAPANIVGTGEEKKPDLELSSREEIKDKKSFEEIAKEMVESGKWMKGKFLYNKDNNNFSFTTTKDGKETIYVINGYDGNLNAGRIKDGEEYYFEISTKKESNDPIYILSPDKTRGKKEIIAVWIKMPKERKDDINKRLKETENSLKNLLNGEDIKNELNEDFIKGIRADLNNENYGELIEKLATLEELSEDKKKEILEEMIKLIKIIEATEGNKGNKNNSERGGNKPIKVEKGENKEEQIEIVEGLLDSAINKNWMDESHKQRILKAIEAKDREAVFDILDEVRDQDVDVSKIEGVSGADYWEKPFKDSRKRTPDIKKGDLRKVTSKNQFIDNELVSAINEMFNIEPKNFPPIEKLSGRQINNDSIEVRKLKVELQASKDKLTRLTDKAVDEKWVEVLDRMKYMEAILNNKYEEIISEAENLASKFPEDQREEFMEKVKENTERLKKVKEDLDGKTNKKETGIKEIDKKSINDIKRGLKSADMSEHTNEIIKAINERNVAVLREIIPELKEKRDEAKKIDKGNITRVLNILTKEFPDL